MLPGNKLYLNLYRPGDHLQVWAESAVEVGRIAVEVGEMGIIKRPAQESFHRLIKAMEQMTHLRLGNVTLRA